MEHLVAITAGGISEIVESVIVTLDQGPIPVIDNSGIIVTLSSDLVVTVDDE
ncbi:MAG: hypothetical protein QNL26_02900 [Acidimicrobiia bacterium]|nr:hypothetical protein [Acidimicrobiia bacterium]